MNKANNSVSRLKKIISQTGLVSILWCYFLPMTGFSLHSFSNTSAFNQNGSINTKDFEAFPYVTVNAPKGGTIRLSANGSFNSMNPFILSGIAAAGIEHTYETLGMYAYDEANTIYGLVAKQFSYDKKNHRFIVTIHEQAKFHNGTTVKSEDIIHTFSTLTTSGHPVYKQIFSDIIKVESKGDKEVIFHIHPNSNRNDIPFSIAGLPVLSKADLLTRDFEKTSMKPLIGTGPYQMSRLKVGSDITYKKSENYWGNNLTVNRGRFNFSKITYKYYKDQNIALTAFKAHRYDWRSENIAKFWATQYQGKAFDEGLVRTELIPDKSPNGMQAFVMNLRKPLFQDIKVRQALNLAFDFQWLNKNLFYETYVRSNSFYSNSPFSANQPLSVQEKKILAPYRDQLPSSVWETPSSYQNQSLSNNLIKAQALLDQTDWVVVGNQRINQQTKQPLSFTLLINSPAMKRIALPYKRVLKRLGITMHVQLISPSNWISRVRKFDYDMITYNWPAPTFPGTEQYLFWHSDSADYPGSRNIMGVKHPAIDKITKTIPQLDDQDELTHQMRALDRILMAQQYVIPHWYIDRDRIAYWVCLSPPKHHPKYGIDLASWYQVYTCDASVDHS
ncbi:MAG: hypothetical protein CMF43_03730 [Legionellales bacterium]|nr:hypothetical protein [Legionellales bacterium]|tara:strand:+ start:154 stop:2001 length:1848 start_codon:yes stop_codon:yes gene_type:complete